MVVSYTAASRAPFATEVLVSWTGHDLCSPACRRLKVAGFGVALQRGFPRSELIVQSRLYTDTCTNTCTTYHNAIAMPHNSIHLYKYKAALQPPRRRVMSPTTIGTLTPCANISSNILANTCARFCSLPTVASSPVTGGEPS